MDKYGLIYEFNNESPIFVKVADQELKKNHVEKALNILEKGLDLFPDYAAAYIIYAKALAYAGDYPKAEETLKTACDLYESENAFEYYKNELIKIKNQTEDINKSRRVSFVDEEKIKPDENKSFEDDLDSLAEKLDNAKIVAEEKTEETFEEPSTEEEFIPKDKEIVSETIAGIYVAQGNYSQAVEVYKQLIVQDPEKRDFYIGRIAELETKIDKHNGS